MQDTSNREVAMVPVLSPSQAARELGVSPQWVVALTKAGRLPCQMTPLGRLIPAEDVERLREEREEAAHAREAATA
jgi:excisionase family DNA binding protein